MRSTASRASSPDNFYGWGIIDALAALNKLNTTDTGHPGPLPETFALSQNYPNPFNLQTHFMVQLSLPAHVRIAIYDLLGREVSVIVDRDRTSGAYEETWNGTTLTGAVAATGVYYARMDVTTGAGETLRFTRNVLLLK